MRIWLYLLINSFLFFNCGNLLSQVYHTEDSHARSTAYNENYKEVTAQLIKPFDNDLSKVRAIFTWIAVNINYDNKVLEEFRKTGKRGGVQISFTTEEERLDLLRQNNLDRIRKTLKLKKGVCQDYSLLFQFMCEEAGLECVYVRGFGRFSPNNIGKPHKKGNHAWNAVLINDQWRLMDVTWSTGMGQRKDYGNGYFDVDPALFIFSHHPDEEKWQLLDQAVDKNTFCNLPFTYSAFLKYKISSFFPRDGYVNKKSKISMELDLPKNERLIVLRGKRPVNLNPEIEGSTYTFDLSQKVMAGKITLAVINEGYIEPLLTLRVR